mgnify:CR=1 FL=1
MPCLYLVESFPEGEPLLEWCASYGLEGIVSKRLSSPYSSGTMPQLGQGEDATGWREANQFRHKMFEGNKKPELTEEQKTLIKKRQELARVQERLQSPGLTTGMARSCASA